MRVALRPGRCGTALLVRRIAGVPNPTAATLHHVHFVAAVQATQPVSIVPLLEDAGLPNVDQLIVGAQRNGHSRHLHAAIDFIGPSRLLLCYGLSCFQPLRRGVTVR